MPSDQNQNETPKAIVILTNFWDANFVLDCGFTLFPCNKDKCYKINFNKKNPNYTIHSIALRTPPIDKKLPYLMNKISTLDFFCPTYDMLKRYKENGNWEAYTNDYHELMRKRKQAVRDWINSLTPDHVYLLCCWENTSLKAKCHRQLLFEAFKNSKLAMEKMIAFYCHGERKMRHNSSINNQNVYSQQTIGHINGMPDLSNLNPGSLVTVSIGGTIVRNDPDWDIDPNPTVYFGEAAIAPPGPPPEDTF